MPCLNEERTIGVCVQKALNAFAALGVTGEVVVCDNGSSDRSVETAESLGARVVHEVVKGYGAALNAGIRASRGRYCIMADCDDSYDWSAIGPFIEKMREGYDMVVGTRLRGTIKPGAMPPLHRFFGNPFLSGLMNLFFRTGVSDAYCGMRAFSKKVYENLGVQAQGMEFAIEMIVRASNQRLSITEIPITLYVDGRGRPAHLRTFVDGWRTLRLLLLYAPDYLYVIPGAALFMVGAFLQALLLRGPTLLAGHYLGIHWLALGCLFCLTGFQVLCFGALAKAFAMNESFAMRGRLFDRFFRKFTLEIGIALGAFLIWMGLLADIAILSTWLVRGMGSLGSTHVVFVATTVIALGVQVVFASFFMGMLRIGISERRR
jgi:glycosyltransferase involved in cell wall biosynthesis